MDEGDAQDDVDYPRIPVRINVEASSATNGGIVSVWLDAPNDGQKIADMTVDNTGDWETYVSHSAEIQAFSGRRDLYLTFAGSPTEQLFRIRSIEFEARLVGTSVRDDAFPAAALLRQNYPNPFGSRPTTIEYSIRAPGHSTLTVYNMLGQKVATLVDGTGPAGSHSVEFSADNLPSGSYFYRLQTSEATTVRVMTVAN